MAHHAPTPGPAGNASDRASGAGRSVPAHEPVRELPPRVRRARDDLFRDADRHGPRASALAWRIAPAIVVLLATLALTTVGTWRELAISTGAATGADLLLVLPVLAAVVFVSMALAPLARVRVEPLLGAGIVLLGAGALLVRDGEVVLATVPSTVGAALVGVGAARLVRRAVWALPLLLAAGVSDAHSVAFGVTDRLLDIEVASGSMQAVATTNLPPELVQRIDLLVLHVPVASGTWLLGIVDVVAIGMLLGLAHLYWRSLAVTGLALGTALAGAVVVGGAVPVLPLLGLAWVVANAPVVWRSTRFSLRRLTYLGG